MDAPNLASVITRGVNTKEVLRFQGNLLKVFCEFLGRYEIMRILRKIIYLAFALAIVLSFGSSEVSSQGMFVYTSGIQIQNLDPADATIVLSFYKQDGTVDTNITDTVRAFGSKTYFPLSVSPGFNGSAIVSSDKRIAAVINVVDASFRAGASYVALTEGANTVYLPLLMKGNSGFNTWFNVQNVGTSDATVNIYYSDGTSVGPVTIKPGAAKTFYQSQENHTRKVFSGRIESNQPVVAVIIEEDSKVMFAYNGFVSGSPYPVMPLVNSNNSGYITGIQIQNMGSLTTTVKVSYTPSAAGTACEETQSIPPQDSKTFALYAFAGVPLPGMSTNCVGGQRFIGSARVTLNSENQPLAVVVNQLKPGVNGEAYGGFDPDRALSKVVMPLIMDRNSGYFTGFNVMNAGDVPTPVLCTFTNTTYQVSGTLNPGQALTDIQYGKIGDRYVGSGTCVASASGAKIVAVVNELRQSSNDELLVYEGIPSP